MTDEVSLSVKAKTEGEALELAERVLETLPSVNEDDAINVPYCYTENRSFNDSEVLTLKFIQDEDDD